MAVDDMRTVCGADSAFHCWWSTPPSDQLFRRGEFAGAGGPGVGVGVVRLALRQGSGRTLHVNDEPRSSLAGGMWRGRCSSRTLGGDRAALRPRLIRYAIAEGQYQPNEMLHAMKRGAPGRS